MVGVKMNTWNRGFFRAVELPYMILYWEIYVITHLSKPMEYTMPRVSPKVDYGLCVIKTRQCRSTSYNKCTALVMDIGRGCAHVGTGSIWEISILSSQFLGNLIVLKIKSI